MPLSEEELRQLEQMERALSEEDPKFASTLRGTAFRRAARRRLVIASCVFALGIAMLLGGVITHVWPVGIAGFVVMLGSSIIGLSLLRGNVRVSSAPDEPEVHHSSGFTVHRGGKSQGRQRRNRPQQKQKGPRPGLRQRMEQRWEHRRQNRGF